MSISNLAFLFWCVFVSAATWMIFNDNFDPGRPTEESLFILVILSIGVSGALLILSETLEEILKRHREEMAKLMTDDKPKTRIGGGGISSG